MNKLIIKTKIYCQTCNAQLRRRKTVAVTAENKNMAKAEAMIQAENWVKKLKNQNCKICQSIIDSYQNAVV